MGSQATSDIRSGVFFMLISAGLFAYFGFAGSWAHQHTTTTPPALLPMVVLLKWTLRTGAVAFAVCAILSLMGSALGPMLYAIAGLATSAIFVTVGVWELTNPQGYFSGVPAILLFIFAAWNGYGSLVELKNMVQRRGAIQETWDPPAAR